LQFNPVVGLLAAAAAAAAAGSDANGQGLGCIVSLLALQAILSQTPPELLLPRHTLDTIKVSSHICVCKALLVARFTTAAK
jgi:hypothetical protein